MLQSVILPLSEKSGYIFYCFILVSHFKRRWTRCLAQRAKGRCYSSAQRLYLCTPLKGSKSGRTLCRCVLNIVRSSNILSKKGILFSRSGLGQRWAVLCDVSQDKNSFTSTQSAQVRPPERVYALSHRRGR